MIKILVSIFICSTQAIPSNGSKNLSVEIQLSNALMQLNNYKSDYDIKLQQIQNALTEKQFKTVSSLIRNDPSAIISDSTSPLQVEAARLLLKINRLQETISDLEFELKEESHRRKEVPIIANFSAFIESKLGKDVQFIDLADPSNEAIVRYGLLRDRVHEVFIQYLSQTDFLSRSEASWLSWISQSRNTLTNAATRFHFARRRAAEYRRALASFRKQQLQGDGSQEMQLEIALRTRALEVYSDAIARMERGGGGIAAHFPEVCPGPQSSTTVTVCAAAGADRRSDEVRGRSEENSEGGSQRRVACGAGCCSRDAPFTFRVGNAPPLTVGALRVLNRRTPHFLLSPAAPADLEARAAALAARTLYRHGEPLPAPGEDPRWMRAARRPFFDGGSRPPLFPAPPRAPPPAVRAGP